MSTLPILVVGSGPSGLVLALMLAKNGVPVRIIEKEPARFTGERGAGMMPRTLELYKILGTLPDILKLAKRTPMVWKYDPSDANKVVKKIPLVPSYEDTPQIPYSNILGLAQHLHEAILKEHLAALGVTVEGGTELRSFKDVGDHVDAEVVRHVDGKEVIYHIETPYLVGMDGAHSVVRKTLGLEFLGETIEEDNFAAGDIRVKDLMEVAHMWGNPTKAVVFLRPSGQDDRIVQFLIAGPEVDVPKVIASRESIIDKFYEITGRRDIVFEDLVAAFRYKPNIRMVKELRVGRVFIGGDAAHCHSFAGGQGMNSCVQDAINLGWKLALVYEGHSPSSLLDTYGEERLPVIAEMLGKTTELFNQNKSAPGEMKRGSELRQLGVNYRGSSIVYEDDVEIATEKGPGYNAGSEIAARPGDRAPGAPGLKVISGKETTTVLMHDILTPSHHTVLIFAGVSANAASEMRDVLQQLPAGTVRSILVLPKDTEGSSASDLAAKGLFDQVIIDTEGYAYSGYHVKEEPSVIVVRPDGIVGARVRGEAGLKKYFQNIFNL
ncbi:hypothetical protein D9613_000933 [Agrocybe pediades]|uniref:FAD-binding domain-containing protein n=1 Tax=Agrocybe pediades TaxID=84607 RepID=A0A8H4R083_9AGAR|nr:hypothetical protein D9613_000933 [Agrocybe pediades]